MKLIYNTGNTGKIQFTDVCFITEDVLRLRAFYKAIFSGMAEGFDEHIVY